MSLAVINRICIFTFQGKNGAPGFRGIDGSAVSKNLKKETEITLFCTNPLQTSMHAIYQYRTLLFCGRSQLHTSNIKDATAGMQRFEKIF